jgi:hypothetical protein
MSNPINFMNGYAQAIETLINQLNTVQQMNAELVADPTLVTRYFATPPASNGQAQARGDIAAADIANAQSAIVQLLFAFNSGAPTQASYLFKVTP